MDTESHPQCLKRLLSCVESRNDGYIPTTTDPVRAVHSRNLWTTDQKLITTGCKIEGQDERLFFPCLPVAFPSTVNQAWSRVGRGRAHQMDE